MKKIFYPGNDRQPCEAQYGIFRSNANDDLYVKYAHIVMVQRLRGSPGTLLTNSSNKVLSDIVTRIMTNDLSGIRAEFVTFNIVMVEDHISAFRLPINLDIKDYIERGNPHSEVPVQAEKGSVMEKLLHSIGISETETTINSVDVVGGCARFYVDFDQRETISVTDAFGLLRSVGWDNKEICSV